MLAARRSKDSRLNRLWGKADCLRVNIFTGVVNKFVAHTQNSMKYTFTLLGGNSNTGLNTCKNDC